MSRNEYYSEEQYEQEQYDEADEAQDTGYAVEEDDYEDIAENDVKLVYRLIEMLRSELENAKTVPFSGNRMVDTEKCLNMLEDLEESLPSAIKRGIWAYNQSEDMLRNAQEQTRRHMASKEIQFQQLKEKHQKRMEQEMHDAQARAKKIIADAERRADSLVSQGVIESRVEDEVRAIRSEAQARAQETMLKVEDACYEKLNSISVSMGKMIKEVERMRAQFEEE